MLNIFYSIVEKFYEMCAYHIEYKLDKDENIVEIEKNTHFGSTKIIYGLTTILIVAFFMLMLAVVGESIIDARNQKIYLNHYNIQEVCFDNETWVECISLGDKRRIRISLDESGSISTLYIKED